MRIVALVKRILLQILRDKRTLALLFIAPLVVLTLMNLVFNGKTVDPVLGIEDGSQTTIHLLKEADIVVKEYEKVSDIDDAIVKRDLDGFLQVKQHSRCVMMIQQQRKV